MNKPFMSSEQFEAFINDIDSRVAYAISVNTGTINRDALRQQAVEAHSLARELLVQPTTDNGMPPEVRVISVDLSGKKWPVYNPATHFCVPLELSDDEAQQVDEAYKNQQFAYAPGYHDVFKWFFSNK